MATKSTEKKTSLEPSEVFCAAGLLMPTRKINELVKDSSGGDLLKWASTDGLNVVSKVKPLDPKFKAMFSGAASLSGKSRNDLVANIVAGFSAAIGVKKFVKSMGDNVDIVDNVYLTGAKWPTAVEKFQLKNEKSGFDYNSSDFVVEVDNKTFYGISLKKKKNVKGADPTIINKAYSTFIDGPSFQKQRDKLNEIRQNYFPNVIRKAQEAGVINIKGLDRMSNSDIWSMKVQAPNGGKKYDLINIKGFNNTDNPVDLSDIDGTIEGTTFFDATKKGQVGLRDFINADLAKEDNELYQGFNKLIQENAEFFATSLIDIVLKTQMQTKLKAKEIGDYFFEFALVTGYADYTPKKKGDDVLNLKPAKVLPQHTILCGLANLAANNKPYLMVYDGDAKKDAEAAKVFYKLKRDGVTILDLQLRYKGDFKQQPQFFATLSDEFIAQMHDECVIER
tara:strand:- start:3285 stop:4634 length:1350 start_codon:yes stop_codon:yes gene_type:complete